MGRFNMTRMCIHIGVSLRIHDDQSLEFQVQGLSNRKKDHKCIQELESLMLQFFQNEVINDMQHEAKLILKSEIFDETWLFGYIPLSSDVKHAKNLRIGIQRENLYLSPQEPESCHMLAHNGIYFP